MRSQSNTFGRNRRESSWFGSSFGSNSNDNKQVGQLIFLSPTVVFRFFRKIKFRMTGTQRQQNEHKQQNHHEDHRLEVPLVALQIQTQGQILGNVSF